MMQIVRASRAAAVLLAAGTVALMACSDSPTSPSDDGTGMAGPSQANISVGVSNTRWGPSLLAGFQFACGFDIRIQESAGLSAALDYIRADFYDNVNGTGSRVERQQILGANLNELPANGTLNDSLVVRFNANETRSVVITVRFTDARGNVLERTNNYYNCFTPWVDGGFAR